MCVVVSMRGDFHLLICLHMCSIEINKVNYNIDLISLCIDNILGSL